MLLQYEVLFKINFFTLQLSPTKGRARSGSFLKTPMPGQASLPGHGGQGQPTNRSSTSLKHVNLNQTIQVGNHTLPAFVQVETLHPGQVFVSTSIALFKIIEKIYTFMTGVQNDL